MPLEIDRIERARASRLRAADLHVPRLDPIDTVARDGATSATFRGGAELLCDRGADAYMMTRRLDVSCSPCAHISRLIAIT